MSGPDFKDVTGRPRPQRDIEAALKYVEAEMIDNPMKMGARNTGPAFIHLTVIRDVLREALK